MIKNNSALFLLTLISIAISTHTAIAQTYQPSNRTPVADRTLGTQVSGSSNNFNITGGVNKGKTLFHSFTDFSVPTNGQANFINPVGNREIITRVTGNSFSDINGLVNTNGANFFLLNPNGIVFGTNAQLNVGRAFVASTANSIDLVDASSRMIKFGTNSSGDVPLLSVAPNVLFDVARLNLGGGNGAINNFGTLQTTNPNQYIGLIGGNVNINGGQIYASGGRVELGGLSVAGSVGLSTDGNTLRAQFPTNVGRGDVSLTNQARVDVAGSGGGDIVIDAQNINILDKSVLIAGINPGLGTPEAVAGDIKLNAIDKVVLSDFNSEAMNNYAGRIFNNLGLNSKGKGGNVTIDAGSVTLRDGAAIEAVTFGQGNAGDVIINAKDAVSFTGTGSGIFTTVEAMAVGKGGTISINASSVTLRDGASMVASTYGQGNAGSINIKVLGAVDIAGIKDGSYSAIFTSVVGGAKGNGGNITIDAGSFSLTDSAKVIASTEGQGNAGDITITAKDAISLTNSEIFSRVETSGVGKGGNININATSVSLKNGSNLATSTKGTGNAGNVTVIAKDNISLVDEANILSSVDRLAVGNGGNITIDANSLLLKNKGNFSTNTRGEGKAGNIQIDVSGTVEIIAMGIVAIDGSFTNNGPTYISSSTGGSSQVVGNAGDITINTGSLSLLNGGEIEASTFGYGNAGNIKVTARNAISLKNAATLGTEVFASAGGNGGNITIEAPGISLLNRSQIVASNQGDGNAGTIQVNATDFLNIFGGIYGDTSTGLFASNFKFGASNFNYIASDRDFNTNAGNIIITSPLISLNRGNINARSANNGGNINIGFSTTKSNQTQLLLLRDGSQISTNSNSKIKNSNGGNITINSSVIVATPGNNDITANANQGTGGQVKIASQGLFGIQYRPKGQSSLLSNDITASSTFGRDGAVNINTPRTDPGKDSTQLPNVTTDASNQISQVCGANTRQNKLTVTGRGGLPPNANDPLTSDVVWQDARAANSQSAVSSAMANPVKLAPPAVGLVFDGKGKVTLIAAGSPGQPTGTRVACPQGVGK